MSRREHAVPANWVGAAALTVLVVATGMIPIGHTYAAWSDVQTVPVGVRAGVWLNPGDPALPLACGGIVFDKIIIGTNASETLRGTSGNDLIFGLQGQDVLDGSSGDDCLVGGNGKDELHGGDGNDVLVGGNAKDSLSAGVGVDQVNGGNGKDSLYGGAGVDILMISQGLEVPSSPATATAEILGEP